MRKIITRIAHALKSHHSPHEIALGIAIGSFVGIIPIYGFQTAIVILLAFIIRRANKIAMLAAVSVFIPPVIPFVLWAEYNIGRLILRGGYPELGISLLKTVRWEDLLDMFWVLLLGSAALGLAYSITMYFVSFYIASGIKRRRESKADG